MRCTLQFPRRTRFVPHLHLGREVAEGRSNFHKPPLALPYLHLVSAQGRAARAEGKSVTHEPSSALACSVLTADGQAGMGVPKLDARIATEQKANGGSEQRPTVFWRQMDRLDARLACAGSGSRGYERGTPKVCQPQVPIRSQEQVLWLHRKVQNQ